MNSSTTKVEVVGKPSWEGGFDRMAASIGNGLFSLTIVYFGFYYCLRGSSSSQSTTNFIGGRWFPSPDPKYCPIQDEDEMLIPCTRSDLFAFQMASGLMIISCAVRGFYYWHIHTTERLQSIPQTPAGRLFGSIPVSEKIAAICFTFQFWDLIISFTIPEHCTVTMLCHHFAAALLCYLSLRYGVLNYYGIFFLGCSEISSIFLFVIDLAKFFPPRQGTLYETIVYQIAAPGFVVCFVIYRFILWWPVSFQLFNDVYQVTYKTKQAQKLRPGCNWVLYIFLILNIPLGLLQLYWLTVIVEEVKNLLK